MGSDSRKAQLAGRLLAIGDPADRERFLLRHMAQLDLGLVEELKGEVDHYGRADVARAFEIAEIARAVASHLSDPLADAVSLRALAEAHHFSNRHREALHCYDHAIAIYERLDSEVEAGRIQRNKILVLMNMGKYKEALRIADEARASFLKHGETNLAAQVDTHVGNIYHRMDDPRRALHYYDRARAVFESSKDEFSNALIDYNRANVLAFLNDFETAERLYVHSRELYKRRGYLLLAADVDYSLALLCALRSRFFEALAVLKEARHLYASGNDEQGCSLCDLDASRIYLSLNLPREAEAAARKARVVFAAQGVPREEAIAQARMAAAVGQAGRLEEALRLFEQAESLFREQGNTFQIATILLARAELLLARLDPLAAGPLAREAVVLFGAIGLPDWTCRSHLVLAEIERQCGRPEHAGDHAKQALDTLGDRDLPDLRYRCHHMLGKSLADTGQTERADRHLDRSLDEIERIWRAVRLDPFRVAFLHDKEPVYADALHVKLSLGGAASVAAAFACAERGRARSIVEMLARHSLPHTHHRKGVDPDLYRRFIRLREELDWFYNRMASSDVAEPKAPRSCDPDRYHKETGRREHELDDIRRLLRVADQEFSDLHGFSSIQAAEIRRSLRPHEALLEYFITGEEILLFVVRPEDILVRTCPATCRQVLQSLNGLRFQLGKFLYASEYTRVHGTALRRSTNRHLADLHDQLLAPVSELIRGRDLIVVPHGPLHYVPFHALRDHDTHVIDRQSVSYAPSAHVYLMASSRPHPPRENLSIMGFPTPATPGIEKEARLLAELLPEADLYLGKAATRDTLSRACRGRRLVHLATHGVFRTDNPMLSSLQLADGPLDVYDIFNLEMEADLVVLSGCETGVSKVANGNELLGLIRGFLHAGATSLLVSLWPVSDRSTPFFMECFYRELLAGQRVRDAVRSAQIAVRDIYAHPFHWAPFVVAGGA